MVKKRVPLILSVVLFYPATLAWAQEVGDSQKLFSASVGQKFYEIAYEIANSKKDISEPEAEQAIIFLTATMKLDSQTKYVLPREIALACQYSNQDHSELMHHLLENYVDKFADLEVIRKAVQYLLEQLNSREEREKLLRQLLQNLGGKNPALDSELDTLLGLLMAETTNPSALENFERAYNNNKYNRLAFAKLAELVGEQIKPAMYLEHLRLALGENPLDMEAALAFAQCAKQLQLYQTAADAYKYCADLFSYLYPSEALPASIYLPWAISSYNTQRNQHRCLQIAEQLRQSGRFDLILEAIAGKAAAKIGDGQQANRILQAAEEEAVKNYQLPNINEIADSGQRTADSKKLYAEPYTLNADSIAWFYCFALPDANKALDWANKAYSVDPNSATAAAILAYSLAINGQTDWAKPLIKEIADSGQRTADSKKLNAERYTLHADLIAALALAQIQLDEQQRDSAITTLKSIIAKDPGSLEAERAKEILTQHGGEYIPPVEPDITLTALKNSFGQAVVPAFISPDKIISVQLNVRGTKSSYASEFGGTVVITNNSPEPLVISNDGLFKGNIRVDATLSGDLNKKIPNLVSVKIWPALPVEPGQSILIPLRLLTAELRRILLTHPQASLDIEFTVYLDPVITAEGKIANWSLGEPATVTVKRPGVKLTAKYLRNRFNSLSKGKQGQKIKAAQLFTGLLAEQHAMTNREPPYKFVYADWMPAMLKSALLHSLADDDWVVKTHTMAAMLPLPLDYELIKTVAENLNDTHWPTRLMAISLLAKNQNTNFNKVLDWTAQYDSNKLVRDMAIALGAAKSQPQEPANQPTQGN